MNRLKELHDYVKANYENGDYQAAEQAYHQWQTTNTFHDEDATNHRQLSDYQRGAQQAQHDYQTDQEFKQFPASLIKLVNLLSKNKAAEVTEFIDGYNAYRDEFLKQAKA